MGLGLDGLGLGLGLGLIAHRRQEDLVGGRGRRRPASRPAAGVPTVADNPIRWTSRPAAAEMRVAHR